jgi:hypothetical protein
MLAVKKKRVIGYKRKEKKRKKKKGTEGKV